MRKRKRDGDCEVKRRKRKEVIGRRSKEKRRGEQGRKRSRGFGIKKVTNKKKESAVARCEAEDRDKRG